MSKTSRQHTLIEKIQALPLEKAAEVEDFRLPHPARITRAAGRLSEKAFNDVWDNPEDAAYDQL